METKKLLKAMSLCGLLVFSSVVPFTTSSARDSAGKSIELKAVSFLPAMNATTKQFRQYADKVGEMSKGELKIKFLGGPEVIPPFEQGQALSRGVVDMAIITPSLIEGMAPESVFILASRISPEEEVKRAVLEKLQPFYAKANLFCLGRLCATSTPVFLTFTIKKVEKPEDLKGLKIGGTGPMSKPVTDAFGADLKVVPLPDAITALDRKVVEGWIAAATGVVPFGIHEHLKYAIDHPYFPIPNVILFNQAKWKALPANLQSILSNTLKEMSPGLGRASDEEELKAQKEMQTAGVKFVKFSPPDAERYLKTVYDAMWANWQKTQPQTAPEFQKLLTP
jgi:TRAP-type transport system periplasmic protein